MNEQSSHRTCSFFSFFFLFSVFPLCFHVSHVLFRHDVSNSVSDFLLVSLLSPMFKIFISRFFDRLVQFRFDTRPCGRELASTTKFTLCCIPIVQLHVYIYKYTLICGNIINRKWTTSITNEYTSLLKYKSLTLYFRKGDVLLCVRHEWRQGETAILMQVLLLTIAAHLSHPFWGCSTVDHWRPSPLQAGSDFGLPVSTD